MAGKISFTMAQVTVLSTMILVAHSMPVELRIAHAAGVRLWFMLVLRVTAAFLLGFILHQIYDGFHLLQGASRILWKPAEIDPSLISWLLSQLKSYAMIFLIIFVLIAIMRILKVTGVIAKLNRVLNPLLRFLGMSKDAAPLTIIGITLGISYGGGLIIKEARSGALSKRDIFLSLSLMGLSHSLIEDTLVMVAMGASLTGILLGRILFTFLVMLMLIRIINRISNNVFMKFFVRRDKESSESEKSRECGEY
jgi:spore maturation protein SpmB